MNQKKFIIPSAANTSNMTLDPRRNQVNPIVAPQLKPANMNPPVLIPPVLNQQHLPQPPILSRPLQSGLIPPKLAQFGQPPQITRIVNECPPDKTYEQDYSQTLPSYTNLRANQTAPMIPPKINSALPPSLGNAMPFKILSAPQPINVPQEKPYIQDYTQANPEYYQQTFKDPQGYYQDYYNTESLPKVRTFEELFNEAFCIFCSLGQVNLILPECSHSCHVKCFLQQKAICTVCTVKKEIQGLEVKGEINCNLCGGLNNLISCPDCLTKHCYVCFRNNSLKHCCEALKNNLEDQFSQCPGCESKTPYSEIVPLKCETHDLLCKKCWNISILTGKCVFNCKLAYSVGVYCHCDVCNKNEIKHLSPLTCPNSCNLCEFCQSRFSIFTSASKCANCQEVLIKKTP